MDETIEFSSEFIYNLVCGQNSEPGDLNEDGFLNILDLVMLANIILYDEGENPAADVNGDGVYNVLDVVMLANIIISQN